MKLKVPGKEMLTQIMAEPVTPPRLTRCIA